MDKKKQLQEQLNDIEYNKKESKKKETSNKKTLQEELDSITFRNEQVQQIRDMQEGDKRLKDNLGRNRDRYISSTEGTGGRNRRVSSAGRVAGLQTLGNSFGK
jgi:hypothetical protein